MNKKILSVLMILATVNTFAATTSFSKLKLLFNTENFEQTFEAASESVASTKDAYSKGFYQSVKAASFAAKAYKNGETETDFSEADSWIKSAKANAKYSSDAWVFAGSYEFYKYLVKNSIENSQIADDAYNCFKRAIGLQSTNQLAYTLASDFFANMPEIVSYGDINYAISYDRRALMMNPDSLGLLGFYKMAEHLYIRDWSKKERSKEIDKIMYKSREGSDSFSKNRYYEGFMPLAFVQKYSSNPWNSVTALSDKDEADLIMKYVNKNLKNDLIGKYLKK